MGGDVVSGVKGLVTVSGTYLLVDVAYAGGEVASGFGRLGGEEVRVRMDPGGVQLALRAHDGVLPPRVGAGRGHALARGFVAEVLRHLCQLRGEDEHVLPQGEDGREDGGFVGCEGRRRVDDGDLLVQRREHVVLQDVAHELAAAVAHETGICVEFADAPDDEAERFPAELLVSRQRDAFEVAQMLGPQVDVVAHGHADVVDEEEEVAEEDTVGE